MAHSAYPELGDSAIMKLLEALAALQKVSWPRDPVLGESTCNIGTISGGRAPNVVPDAAQAEVMIRLVNNSGELKKQVLAALGDRVTTRVVLEEIGRASCRE